MLVPHAVHRPVCLFVCVSDSGSGVSSRGQRWSILAACEMEERRRAFRRRSLCYRSARVGHLVSICIQSSNTHVPTPRTDAFFDKYGKVKLLICVFVIIRYQQGRVCHSVAQAKESRVCACVCLFACVRIPAHVFVGEFLCACVVRFICIVMRADLNEHLYFCTRSY